MIESPLQASSSTPLAGFWLRFIAAVIDLAVLAVPLSVFISFLSVAMKISTAFLELRPGEPPREVLQKFGNPFICASLAFFILVSWLYFALLESSGWRATLGKRLLGLYVADASGNRASFGRTSRRFFFGRALVHVPYIGVYYFLFDCIWVALTPAKEAIHDKAARCRVFREPTIFMSAISR
jgi:uncharacterized RDD family membrane protein YckC